METLLISIHPLQLTSAGRKRPILEMRKALAYIVFQLKCPSYAMLRRCGRRVKSNLPSSVSSPGKKVSNGTASTDKAAKTSPVEVK
jgi:hypothetical protein